ncbi:MAG TPA: phage major capsid protein [Pyrinomonadaceae bacterium]|jgi:HK97 family phage major capsid protein|nr:phage major capsid protein [Pyrinomonadaceae bacterium]
MASKLQQALQRRDELQAKVGAAFKRYDGAAEGEDTTAVEKEIEDTNAELKSAQAEVERLTNLETMRVGESDSTKGITRPGANGGGVAQPGTLSAGDAEIKSLARSSRFGELKYFKGDNGDVEAYKFARWFLGTVGNMKSHLDWVKSHGIEVKAQQESINTAGGFLVPGEFSSRIISLTEEFGVFRPNTYIEPMGRDTKNIPRRLGGVQFYFVGEGQRGTESAITGDLVGLVAKKIMAIVVRSSEVDEDALVNFGDVLAGDIAAAKAEKEDLCGFNGDGTAGYGGTVGLRTMLKSLSANRAEIAGLHVAAGPTWGDITLRDLSAVLGLLPAFVFRRGKPKWYTSQTFWANVMQPLALAAGGTTAAEVQKGTDKMFLGYPVETTEVFPHQEAADDIPLTFGALELSSTLGDRRQLTLAVSTEYKWAEDQIGIKATARLDIKNHDVGNASADPEERQAGPMVGLITAES